MIWLNDQLTMVLYEKLIRRTYNINIIRIQYWSWLTIEPRYNLYDVIK